MKVTSSLLWGMTLFQLHINSWDGPAPLIFKCWKQLKRPQYVSLKINKNISAPGHNLKIIYSLLWNDYRFSGSYKVSTERPTNLLHSFPCGYDLHNMVQYQNQPTGFVILYVCSVMPFKHMYELCSYQHNEDTQLSHHCKDLPLIPS